MHSGFDIPAPPENSNATNTSSPPLLLSINHHHQILDTTTQQLFLHDHHNFLPPPHHHHYAAASSPYFPLNFKLGLNEFCSTNDHQHYRDDRGDEEDALMLRGSEQYSVPPRQHPSLGMLHSWQPHQDSANINLIKQPPFWEAAEVVSNANSESRQQQDLELSNEKHIITTKSRSVHFGELEAIYNNNNNKRLIDTTTTTTTTITTTNTPDEIRPEAKQPVGSEEASMGEEAASASASASASLKKKKKRSKKKKKTKKKKKGSSAGSYSELFSPMTKFFGKLVEQVMDHQESLQKKFSEAIERLDEERRARELAWRNQELAHLEEEAEARARERASATTREAIIVSYLEKITGQTIQRLNPDHQHHDYAKT